MKLPLVLETLLVGYLPAQALAALQTRRLNDILAFARQRAPYLADKYRALPQRVERIQQLPVLTKLELVEQYDRILTDPQANRAGAEAFTSDPGLIGDLYLGRYSAWVTSGSTGLRAVVLGDAGWRQVMGTQARVRLAWQQATPSELWRRLRHGAGRSAYLLGVDTHFTGISMAMGLRATRAWQEGRIAIIPVTLPLDQMVRRLNEFQPTAITGYGSAMGLLAEEQLAGRLHIAPRWAINTAETLTAEDRARIREAFNCQVRDIYSSTEAGVLAYECRYGAMHINADRVIVEAVNSDYSPTPAGQISQNVLVTNLTNRVLPILRYELRDQVSIAPGGCRCGLRLPVITFHGRTDHVLVYHTRVGQPVKLLPLALSAVIKQHPGVLAFQVVQGAEAVMQVRLNIHAGHTPEGVWEAVMGNLSRYLASQGLAHVVVQRDPAPPQRDPVSNKLHETLAAAGRAE